MKGVRINAVVPVFTDSPMLDALYAEDPELEEEIADTHTLGRLLSHSRIWMLRS